MNFKRAYLITIIFSLLGFIFQLLFRDKIIYSLYGYDPSIIGTSAFEAFQATKETYFARNLSYVISLGITVLCFISSCIAIHRRIYLKYYFTYIVFIISLLLILLYFIASSIPKRSF
jgi:magnesium-transporting ATPase (P-type)